MTTTILEGDCLELLPTLEANSISAIITDPPYCLDSIRKRFGSPNAKPTSTRQHKGIAKGFMSQTWDTDIAFRPEVWEQCLRVLKPGGYMVAFGGCRTYHRLVCAIEDAGFVIHPMLVWAFGTGFPKASNASKAIDKHLGAERDVIAPHPNPASGGGLLEEGGGGWASGAFVTAPATPEAAQWEGWSYGLQSLKPSLECICLAQKPMEGTGAQNILRHGVGAVNIGGCRVGTETRPPTSTVGRWPPNLLVDGSEEVVGLFPQAGGGYGKRGGKQGEGIIAQAPRGSMETVGYGDAGSAARFFPALGYTEAERLYYCAKAGKRDRAGSGHPTIKPQALLCWLIKLITPPNGVVLDCFAGSGSTGEAAQSLGHDCILIEREAAYIADIRRRLEMPDLASGARS
jgi:site-specific DNA-methyltransferase (adenine-specific)